MSERKLSRAALVCIALVELAGAAAAIDMLQAYGGARGSEFLELAVFSLLGIGWSLLTFRVDRRRGGRTAVSLAPVSFQALFPLAGREVVATVALLTILIDWVAHRRRPLQGFFNTAQVMLGSWVASHVAVRVLGLVDGLFGIVVAALAGAVVYSLLNLALTQTVVSLATGRSAKESGIIAYSTLTNEIVVSCFAALVALSWAARPVLIVVAVVPLTLLFLVLSRLEQREGALRRRQSELQSIQELGLRVSAQLDAQPLAAVITEIVAQHLKSRGALLIFVGESEHELEIAAVHDLRQDLSLPSRLPRGGLDEQFLESGQPLIGDALAVHRFPELALFAVTSFLAHPLAILGRPAGALVVYDDGSRDPFTEQDAQRLSSLVRFIEVALNNARLYDDLRRMQQHLAQTEKLTAMGQLVSGVAHELNNPLATIMGTAELLNSKQLTEEHGKMLWRIRREADRAARIVRNLLTFSRQHKPEVGWHALNAIVEEVLEIRQYECRVRNIMLTMDLDPNLPPVRVDPHQIHQVLLNLVTNAIHAVEGTDRPGLILVRTYRDGDGVRLEIADNGPGIPEENIGKIFNPFFTTKQVGKGTGLGLSICYGIVHEHGGTIRVRSVPGRGATFTVELPVPDRAPEIAEAAPVMSEEHAAIADPMDGDGGRVLVIDDEIGIRVVLSDALSAWGFEPEQASDGEQALALLRENRYVLAILDLRMPGLDGQSLYTRAQDEQLALPPVIFSTGDSVSPQVSAFLEQTGAPVLSKPFTLAALKETIESTLAAAARR